MKNAGWLFYRNYYQWLAMPGEAVRLERFAASGKLAKEPKEVLFKEQSQALTGFSFNNEFKQYFPAGTEAFKLKTCYPGLLVGSGYGHQTGTTGEFKLGFFFDHCTGLPLIPGSSVKGLLRSVFPGEKDRAPVRVSKAAFIHTILGELRPELAQLELNLLRDLIFEGKTPEGKYLPMHRHDVFLDACISGTENPGARIFDEDYLTPHPDPLKNPVPVRFLKILPDVTFQFHFRLQEAVLAGLTISANEKKQLFFAILKTLGAGAKTNVGYGQFEPV